MTDAAAGQGTGQVVDFELGPDLCRFRDEVRAFAQEHLAPNAMELDRKIEFPRASIQAAGEAGYLGIVAPEAYGGLDQTSLASCLMLEELGAACAATAVTISVHASLAVGCLCYWGTDDQRERYLRKLATGEWLGAYCLSEAGSGSDAAALVCEAKEDGDSYVLNGPKLWITTGSEASFYVVFARTGEDRVKGITAFLVERDFAGVGIGSKERKLGIKASPTVELLLDNVRVPKSNVLGEVGKGFSLALALLDSGRIGIAAQSLGISRAALELIKQHLGAQADAKGRSSAAQEHMWEMSDLASDLDACRLLTWRAASLRDRGLPCGPQAAMAKLKASQLANRATRSAVTILGQSGLVGEAERLMRDARVTEIYEGVTDVQRLVIARSLLA